MKIFKVGLVGVTGYTGMELARLLASHPRMKLEMACSRTESGLRLGEFYPFLEGLPGSDVVISIFDAKEAARRCDLVFLAVPHGKAMEMAGELLEAGTRVIDLSADFRLRDVNVYEDWYVPHTRRELLPEAVKRGAIVVDNSHAFRMDPEVPLASSGSSCGSCGSSCGSH